MYYKDRWDPKPCGNRGNFSARKRDTKPSKGSRFSQTELPADWREWTEEKRPDLDPEDVFDRFHDYWIAKPGADGIKIDWFATWRNWIRKELVKAPESANQQSQRTENAKIPCEICGQPSSEWWLSKRYCPMHVREAHERIS